MNPVELEDKYGAHNYHPLPVMLVKGKGVYVWDEKGKRYLDFMSAYSALSHGHSHPRLLKALQHQSETLAVTSRAFYSDRLGPFLKKVCEIVGLPRALPMNSGAEAVETAIKAARKWGYNIKGVGKEKAEIIACRNNFHGRTISIISMSSELQYRNGFDPLTPGFKIIAYGDSAALSQAITPNTVAFIVEPIQGEAGIVVPPKGYLKECEKICRDNNVLLIVDEIQSGLGRTGKWLACEHDEVKPDGVALGKALGGGLLPVSLFLSRDDVMDVFTPGDHGSTFGGNPLAATVALEALLVLEEEKLLENASNMGDYFISQLKQINKPAIKGVRGRGLFVGLEIDTSIISAREVCLKLMEAGLLCKETHATIIRLVPPLIITREQIDEALNIINNVFQKI